MCACVPCSCRRCACVRVGGLCLSARVGWSIHGSLNAPIPAFFFCSEVSGVRGATHLPYDKEDERGAQHQGEHVAEGREGERHGCASQPDDGGGLRGQKGTSSPLALCLWVQLSPTLLSLLLLEVTVCFQPAPSCSLLPPPPHQPGMSRVCLSTR